MSITAVTNFETLFSCPITNCLMENPQVIKQCGHVFEASVLQEWLKEHPTCPLCRREAGDMKGTIVRYQLIRDAIEIIKNEHLLEQDSAQSISLQDPEAEKILKTAICAMNQIRPLALTWTERLNEVKQWARTTAITVKQQASSASTAMKETCGYGNRFPFE